MSRVFLESISSDPITGINTIQAPTGIAVTFIGSGGATTYRYLISSLNEYGESLATGITTLTLGNATLNTTNFNRISWSPVFGATRYRVYGRTSGNERLITETRDYYFDDTGSITPTSLSQTVNTTGYDPDKISIGSAYTRLSDASISVFPYNTVLINQTNISISGQVVCAVRYSEEKDLIFTDEFGAAATRSVCLLEYYKKQGIFNFRGSILVTFPTVTSHTIRGLSADYRTFQTGSVVGVGTIITGTATDWVTNRIPSGCRIGFAASNPEQVNQWYTINSVVSNTTIFLTETLISSVPANTPYIIEDLCLLVLTTNATAANGGLFLIKGISPDTFTFSRTTIPAAATTDNIRACYFLTSAVTNELTTGGGVVLDSFVSPSLQTAYCIDGATSVRIYAFNIRASLTGLSAGATTSAFLFRTGAQAVTGSASQVSNLVLATTKHGPGLGVSSLYYVTTTRVKRAPITSISSSNVNWNATDEMTQVSPGNSVSYTAMGSFTTIDYVPSIDRFIVYVLPASSNRHFVTQYRSDGGVMDSVAFIDTKSLDLVSSDRNISPTTPAITVGTTMVSATIDFNTYMLKGGTTLQNNLYNLTFGADATYSGISNTSQRIILPRFLCTGVVQFGSVFLNINNKNGVNEFNQVPSEPMKLWYRTTGITNNSGAWISVPNTGDMSGVSTSSVIQFSVGTKTIGGHCFSSKFYGLGFSYENSDVIPSFLNWNFTDSISTSGIVGFIQNYYYGGNFNLNIDYFRASDNALILSQNSLATTSGTFQYWSDSSWITGIGSDLINARRRFVPTQPLGITSYYVKLRMI